jgi:uncharacterized protein YbbK (DUF523 family)
MKNTQYLVSACLAGEKCRRNQTSATVPEIQQLIKNWKAIAICPEVLAWLTTPRPPCEILHDKVVSKDGEDFTCLFQEGAKKALKIAQKNDIKTAILKSKSPSCWYKETYDGSFSWTLTKGNGITAELLENNDIYSNRKRLSRTKYQ